mmetsp:Transcript_9456/g.26741  ORF Transcript_9456/g.26741 Transcript_9456/m.26741 type:complete len:215 (-) Transcript_9456:352-996(-)
MLHGKGYCVQQHIRTRNTIFRESFEALAAFLPRAGVHKNDVKSLALVLGGSQQPLDDGAPAKGQNHIAVADLPGRCGSDELSREGDAFLDELVDVFTQPILGFFIPHLGVHTRDGVAHELHGISHADAVGAAIGQELEGLTNTLQEFPLEGFPGWSHVVFDEDLNDPKQGQTSVVCIRETRRVCELEAESHDRRVHVVQGHVVAHCVRVWRAEW